LGAVHPVVVIQRIIIGTEGESVWEIGSECPGDYTLARVPWPRVLVGLVGVDRDMDDMEVRKDACSPGLHDGTVEVGYADARQDPKDQDHGQELHQGEAGTTVQTPLVGEYLSLL